MDDPTGSPTCPNCHTLLEVAGTIQHPYWHCPRCRIARLN